MHAHPPSLYLPSRTKFWCTLQLRGQIHYPAISSLPLCVLCVPTGRPCSSAVLFINWFYIASTHGSVQTGPTFKQICTQFCICRIDKQIKSLKYIATDRRLLYTSFLLFSYFYIINLISLLLLSKYTLFIKSHPCHICQRYLRETNHNHKRME